jgi:two-component system, OmpR family, sensor histidine kinase BaeS
MFHTLRGRLILNHLLSLLIVIPLTGFSLIYVLETQILLPSLQHELEGQAKLVAEIATREPDIWSGPAQAQDFITRLSPQVADRLLLLDGQGRVLASSDPADSSRVGQPLAEPDVEAVLSGQMVAHLTNNLAFGGEMVDVLEPVAGADQRVVGVVRLSYRLSVYGRIFQSRYMIIGVLLTGVVVGVVVGWGFGLNLQRPLRQVADALGQLGGNKPLELLPEQEWDEVNLLVRAFNALVERTRSLETARQHLLANLVHELGRPLGALLSAIKALQRGAAADQQLRDELLAGMEEGVRHLRHLLDDLARMHEQVVGLLELNCRPVSLGEWLPQVLGLWRAAALSKAMQWQVTLPADLPVLDADPDRLAQALGNLLNNAIQYSPVGGAVVVEAGTEPEWAWIRVSDTGPGIAPDSLPHIFEPFYRGQVGRRFPQGMGLGLSIAQDLVVAHGGRIEVESWLARGSHFTIWLPRPRESTLD